MVSLEILRQMPCFRGLHAEQLQSIAAAGELRCLEKDAYLFRRGDRAEAMYILVSGQLVVSMDDARGRALQLALITPGMSLGEMGLSQSLTRSADVIARTNAVLLQLHRDQFFRLVREQPEFSLRLLADLSGKLQAANRRLESTVSLSVKDRLWLVLNRLGEAGCITPAPSVTDLAEQIDASREMTSRALSQLVREKKVAKESVKSWRIQQDATSE